MDLLFGSEPETWAEDCLHLNVWTPAPDGSGARPVMVWIHGGGFEMGSGSSPLYDGVGFANRGVVLVSLNYRLGSVGFLELGHVDPSYAGSGNVGLLDQIAALEWVRDNIAAFGGDPSNVTVFGESAGAMSVSLLLSMPKASGLFHRAIAQSGAATAGKSLDQARFDTEEFMTTAQLPTIDALVSAPIEMLLSAHATIGAARMADPEGVIRRAGNPLAFLPFRPTADGVDVPLDPMAAISAGSAAGVPLIVGTNAEEWNLFALMTTPAQDDADLAQRVGLVAPDPDAVLAAYRAEHPDFGPKQLESAVLTDVVFRVPAARMSDAQRPHAPVFEYLFSWGSPAWGGQIGASHAVEIPFVFDVTKDPRLAVFVGDAPPAELASAMHGAWIAFATDGQPGGGGLPEWPAITENDRATMVLDTESTLQLNPGAATLAAWDEAVTPEGELAARSA